MMMNARSAMDRSSPAREAQRARLVNYPQASDMFTDLPKPLAHKIMTYLTNKEAIRIGILSRHFHSLWRSFPILEFDHNDFSGRATSRLAWLGSSKPASRFAAYVRETLRRREIPDTDLQRLTFRCYGMDGERYFARDLVEEMALYALNNNVRELFLNFLSSFVPGLPSACFSSVSMRKLALTGLALGPGDVDVACPNLEELKLHCCTMGSTLSLSSPRLKTANFNLSEGSSTKILIGDASKRLESLYCSGGNRFEMENLSECAALKFLDLEHVDITDEWFRSQVAGLPALESLKIRYCSGPRNLYLRNMNLGCLDIEDCTDIASIHTDSKMLRFFRFCSMGDDSACKRIHIRECSNVRELDIRGASACVTSQWVEETVRRLEFLQKMVLSHCHMLDRVFVAGPRLQGVELIRCKGLAKFDIDAPNMVWFVLDGKFDYLTPTLVRSPKLHAEIKLQNFNRNDYPRLRDFLSNFAHCNTLSISNYRDERLTFPRGMRPEMVPPLIGMRDLHINVSMLTCPSSYLIGSSLWLAARPRVLRISVCSKPYVTMKLYYKDNYNKNGDGSDCCNLSPVKCWRHSVKEIEVETFPGFNEPWEVLCHFLVQRAYPVMVRRVMSIML